MILRQKTKAEVQNDAMHDRGPERSNPRSRFRTMRYVIERVKRADPQRVKEHRQLHATSTKRAGDDEVTHARRYAPGREQDQVPHSRSARGVDSLIFDSRVNRTLRRLNSNSSWRRLQIGHASRCETTGADGSDSAWKPSSCSSSTRPWISVPTQRQIPAVRTIRDSTVAVHRQRG